MTDNHDFDAVMKRLESIESTLLELRKRVDEIESALPVAVQPEVAAAAPESVIEEQGAAIFESLESVVPPSTPTPEPEPTAAAAETEIPVSPYRLPEAQMITEPVFVESESALSAWLRKVKILPPKESSMSIEMLIGSWWLPRIAVLLGVIGVAWLAIYFSRSTPPPLRFAGILSASAGISLLGYLMERRGLRDFGMVLFATGLALIYFTVFAGYIFPAVKLINNAAVASLLQFLIIAGIIALALWRNSHTIAAMAVLLGYVSCFFSFAEQMHEFALGASFLLAVAGAVFYLWRQWKIPYQTSIPGAYLIYACILVFVWMQNPSTAPGMVAALLFPLAALVLFAGTDVLAALRAHLMPRYQRRFFQLSSSATAIAVAYLATRSLFPDHLSRYYFTFGSVLAGFALLLWRLHRADGIAQAYFIKGTALLTLGLIVVLGGHQRWIALGAEAFVLLLSAKRARMASIEATMMAVWYVSIYYFLEFFGQRPRGNPLPWLSVEGMLSIVYVAASAILFSLYGRWFCVPGTRSAKESLFDTMSETVPYRNFFLVINAAAVGFLTVTLAERLGDVRFVALKATGFAIALGALAVVMRHWVPVVAALLAYLFGCRAFFGIFFVNTLPVPALWQNAAGIFAASASGLLGLQWAATHARALNENFAYKVQWVIHVLWLAVLHMAFSRTFAIPEYSWLAGLVLAVALAAFALAIPLATLADVSFLPILFVFLEVIARQSIAGKQPFAERLSVHVWLIAIPFVYAIWFSAVGRLRERLWALRANNIWQWIHLVLAVWIGYEILDFLLPPESLMLVLAAGSLAIAALRIWPSMEPATPVALAWLAASHIVYYALPEHSGIIAFPVLIAVATLAQPLLIRRTESGLSAQLHTLIQSALGIAALSLLFMIFLGQSGELRNYVTIFWGISACVIFLSGMLARMKPLRIVGLVGLALCLPRLFLIDIRSTVYRIGAFIGLCLVLLVVGYLYNRYRSVIERTVSSEEQ